MTDLYGWLITIAAIVGLLLSERNPVDQTERRIIELTASRTLDKCVVLMRAELGERFDSELVRVFYFDDGDIAPWVISIGTTHRRCLEFRGHTSDAAFAYFRNEFPAMAEQVRGRMEA